jgi:hypothetical protein
LSFLLIVGVFNFLDNITAKDIITAKNNITCETTENLDWLHAAEVKTCFMKNTTVIDQKHVKISTRDGAVRGLSGLTEEFLTCLLELLKLSLLWSS